MFTMSHIYLILAIIQINSVTSTPCCKLASTKACFNAVNRELSTIFNAPVSGTIIGVELVHESGAVYCNGQGYTNWGCEYFGQGMLTYLEKVVEMGNDLGYPTGEKYYPTSATDDITTEYDYGWSKVYKMSTFNIYSERVLFINPKYNVAQSDQFMLQYSEADGASRGDNAGTACASVYFMYDSETIGQCDSVPSTTTNSERCRLLASSHACFDAVDRSKSTIFNSPSTGTLSEVELIHKSGNVTCDYRSLRYNNWGCEWLGNVMMTYLEKVSDMNTFSGDTYYPTSTTNDIVSEWGSGYWRNYKMNSYTIDSNQILFVNPVYSVSNADKFMLQYGEADGASNIENDGISCAEVYFIFDTVNGECEDINIPDNINNDVLQWVMGNNNLPDSLDSLVMGYNDDKQQIWMIGGWNVIKGYQNNLIKYDLNSNTFTASTVSVNVPSNSQSFTQIEKTIYMILGNTSIATFDMTSEEFLYPFTTEPIPNINDNSCLANIDGQHLIVLGGNNWYEYSTAMDIYDINTKTWTTAPNMIQSRTIFTCIWHNNYLYAIGGQTGWDHTNNIPVYTTKVERILTQNIETQTWIEIGDLSQPLAYSRGVVFTDNIYIIGGYESDNWLLTDNVEIINTTNNDIAIHSTLLYPVSSVGVVATDSSMFVMGGYIDYSLVTNEWQWYTTTTFHPDSNSVTTTTTSNLLQGTTSKPQTDCYGPYCSSSTIRHYPICFAVYVMIMCWM
eukprot:93119_1